MALYCYVTMLTLHLLWTLAAQKQQLTGPNCTNFFQVGPHVHPHSSLAGPGSTTSVTCNALPRAAAIPPSELACMLGVLQLCGKPKLG